MKVDGRNPAHPEIGKAAISTAMWKFSPKADASH